MKHLKKFNENYHPINEEFGGLALIASLVGALALPAAYDSAKKFWSKNIVGLKYKETGRVENVVTKLTTIAPTIFSLTDKQRSLKEVVTELKEYQDIFGNMYWGYDHLHSDDEWEDFNAHIQSCDFYTALYKAEDLEQLKAWLADGTRYSGQISKLPKPKPVEMIWKKEGPRDPGGNY